MKRKFPIKRITKKNTENNPNKKILNAQKVNYDGIQFKSKLELFCYKKLKEYSIEFQYEKERFMLFEGFRPTMQCYFPNKTGDMVLDITKLRNITYTPDFVGGNWIIETKGRANDTYGIKLKLFRALLEGNKTYKIFMEPHNQKQVMQCIKLIKNYKHENE